MRYGSVCSGIEAVTVAWEPLGYQPQWFAEIEPFCCAVLQHHYPTVPNLGDFTHIGENYAGSIELLAGGTPCQSFSVAGLRGGLGDDRGNLALHFLKLAHRLRPTWLVWENVPGVFSSLSHPAPDPCPPPPPLDLECDGATMDTHDDYQAEESHAFACFLAGLSELGYGFAYRVLNAQYFGVPQRRRRVFVVGYFGDWRPAAAVLFERQSLSGHPPPGRETGQNVAASLTRGTDSQGKGGYAGRRREDDVNLVMALTANGVGTCGADDNQAQGGHLVARCLNASGHGHRNEPSSENYIIEQNNATSTPPLPSLRAHATPNYGVVIPLQEVGGRQSKNQNGIGIGIGDDGSQMYTLQSGQQHGVAYDARNGQETGEVTQTLQSHHKSNSLNAEPLVGLTPGDRGISVDQAAAGMIQPCGMQVRRLTPKECERLQGFPDDYTRIPWRGKPAEQCPDGPRYRVIGNSMAVPVMQWIGERIACVREALTLEGESSRVNS